jgi:hypothetical protein
MKKKIKGKLIPKEKMMLIKGGGPGDYPGFCIIRALDAGVDPMRACCPGCNPWVY